MLGAGLSGLLARTHPFAGIDAARMLDADNADEAVGQALLEAIFSRAGRCSLQFSGHGMSPAFIPLMKQPSNFRHARQGLVVDSERYSSPIGLIFATQMHVKKLAKQWSQERASIATGRGKGRSGRIILWVAVPMALEVVAPGAAVYTGYAEGAG